MIRYSDAMNADRMIHFTEAQIKEIPHKVLLPAITFVNHIQMLSNMWKRIS